MNAAHFRPCWATCSGCHRPLEEATTTGTFEITYVAKCSTCRLYYYKSMPRMRSPHYALEYNPATLREMTLERLGVLTQRQKMRQEATSLESALHGQGYTQWWWWRGREKSDFRPLCAVYDTDTHFCVARVYPGESKIRIAGHVPQRFAYATESDQPDIALAELALVLPLSHMIRPDRHWTIGMVPDPQHLDLRPWRIPEPETDL